MIHYLLYTRAQVDDRYTLHRFLRDQGCPTSNRFRAANHIRGCAIRDHEHRLALPHPIALDVQAGGHSSMPLYCVHVDKGGHPPPLRSAPPHLQQAPLWCYAARLSGLHYAVEVGNLEQLGHYQLGGSPGATC